MQAHYLTTDEASEYLGLSASYLAKLRMRGNRTEGPRYIKVGLRAVRYSRAELDKWMESRAIQMAQNRGGRHV